MNDKRKELIAVRRSRGECGECGAIAKVFTPENMYCITCYLKKISIYNFGSVKYVTALKKLLKAQNNKCAYSGRAITLGENNAVDHITPKARKGKDTIENMCFADREINVMKKDLIPEDLIALCKKVVSYAKKP